MSRNVSTRSPASRANGFRHRFARSALLATTHHASSSVEPKDRAVFRGASVRLRSARRPVHVPESDQPFRPRSRLRVLPEPEVSAGLRCERETHEQSPFQRAESLWIRSRGRQREPSRGVGETTADSSRRRVENSSGSGGCPRLAVSSTRSMVDHGKADEKRHRQDNSVDVYRSLQSTLRTKSSLLS
jgi:hypothetical protein